MCFYIVEVINLENWQFFYFFIFYLEIEKKKKKEKEKKCKAFWETDFSQPH